MISGNFNTPALVLASSSAYRKALLQRLGLNFDCISPELDESLQQNETALQACQRLALAKAQAVHRLRPQDYIIGSDQLCSLNRPNTKTNNAAAQILGKPGDHANAVQQLQALSGQQVEFTTAVCVLSGTQKFECHDLTTVRFRSLSLSEIERYLKAEPEAIYCAGSFMSERLGISLCETIRSDDPSALIGLPLIGTAKLLRQAGLTVP